MKQPVKRKRGRPRKTPTRVPVKKQSTIRKYAMHALRTIMMAFVLTYISASFCLYFDAGFKAWTITMFVAILVTTMFSNVFSRKG